MAIIRHKLCRKIAQIKAIEAGSLGRGLDGKARWQPVGGMKCTDEEPVLSCEEARDGPVQRYGTDKAVASCAAEQVVRAIKVPEATMKALGLDPNSRCMCHA